MRWRKRYRRIVKRFALFPVKARMYTCFGENTEFRWLETVYLVQQRDWFGGVIPFWRTTTFADRRGYDKYITEIQKEKENG